MTGVASCARTVPSAAPSHSADACRSGGAGLASSHSPRCFSKGAKPRKRRDLGIKLSAKGAKPSNHAKGFERMYVNRTPHVSHNQPLHERVKFRKRQYGNRVHVSEYRDTPEETFKRIIMLVQDSQDNVRYCYELRDWALAIVREADAQTRDEMIYAIYDWIKRNMTYVNDPAYNELIHSSEVLMNRYYSGAGLYGDCDDFTILMCSMLLTLGIPCRARMIKLPQADGTNQFAHIYPMARAESGEWVALDATEKDRPIGWEAPTNYGKRDFDFWS